MGRGCEEINHTFFRRIFRSPFIIIIIIIIMKNCPSFIIVVVERRERWRSRFEANKVVAFAVEKCATSVAMDVE